MTTVVDAGSAGPGNFHGFRRHVIEPSPLRILPFINVSFPGIFAFWSTVMVGEATERMLDRADVGRLASDPALWEKVLLKLQTRSMPPVGLPRPGGIGDLERGNRLYRAGRYPEAVAAYQEALRDGEGSPQLRYNLGTALLRSGATAGEAASVLEFDTTAAGAYRVERGVHLELIAKRIVELLVAAALRDGAGRHSSGPVDLQVKHRRPIALDGRIELQIGEADPEPQVDGPGSGGEGVRRVL